jgi:hypothetical protein
VEPFATWIMVIRILVGKNFSGSVRLWALLDTLFHSHEKLEHLRSRFLL